MYLWSWRDSKHHIQHEHTHIYLYTDFQNCHLIHCGTLRVGSAPVPGDSIAVELKLSPLTLIHVCFQIRCQGSQRMGNIMFGNNKHLKRDPGTSKKRGRLQLLLLWEKEGWSRYQNWAETQWAWCPEPEPSPGRASNIPYGGTDLALRFAAYEGPGTQWLGECIVQLQGMGQFEVSLPHAKKIKIKHMN